MKRSYFRFLIDQTGALEREIHYALQSSPYPHFSAKCSTHLQALTKLLEKVADREEGVIR